MARLRFLLMLCVAALLATTALTLAQAKPTRTVITLNNGTTVSGELVDATPAGVTLKPNAKAQPVMTPWATIKRIGGGISREQIVAEWQKTKPELICDDCKATGTTPCSTCDGKDVDPAQKQPCEKCQSTGSTGKCRTPNCVDGKIPCPDKCLKPESFTGTPDAQGKRWRSFRGKSGTMRVSDGHAGQRVIMVNGDPQVIQEPCPTCAGTTRVVDAKCEGTGNTLCVPCKGRGVTGPDCASCEAGKRGCDTCEGSGLKAAVAD